MKMLFTLAVQPTSLKTHFCVFFTFCFNDIHYFLVSEEGIMQNKIKELRTQLSITQRELADMVGTSQQQISV
jgi:hypothetical protein